MHFQVSGMSFEQLDACVDVFLAALPGSETRTAWAREEAAIRLRELWDEPRSVGLIAQDEPGDITVGFSIGNYVQTAEGTALRIGEVCVHPSRQGFGLGSRLLLGMQELGKAAGAVSIYLIAEPATAEFCAKLGFVAQQEWIVMGRRIGN